MSDQMINQTKTPKFISVANQKGGVGKTTTSVNLAASLAFGGYKTLLVDLDPQGNASGGLGIDRHSSATVYDILIGRKELNECIQETQLPGLCVVPANQNLIGAEVELINAISREKKLKAALKKLPQGFDFVIFDCAPSLGLLTINAFTASHSILIPTQCEYYAMEGLGQLLSTYQIVREDLNEELEIEGVLLTMFDSRNKLTHEVVKEMRAHFPEKLFETVIPRNVKLSEAPSFGKPVVQYDGESKGATSYIELAKEMLVRNGLSIDGFNKKAALTEKSENNAARQAPTSEVIATSQEPVTPIAQVEATIAENRADTVHEVQVQNVSQAAAENSSISLDGSASENIPEQSMQSADAATTTPTESLT